MNSVERRLPRRAVAGWILFDPAAQPVYTLITTFVFAPYFAGRLATTPAEGQALWGFATAAAGIAIALAAPVLGAVADATGRRKPWIAAFSVLLVAGCAMLWWTAPGAPGAVTLALAGYVVATIGVEFATVFTNAMMPGLVSAERLGRLSGIGWAVGYVGGLLCLALMLVFALADPATGRTLAGLAPIFGLEPAGGGGARLAGPFSALWYAVLALPLFLFVPDRPHRRPLGMAAIRAGLGELRATLGSLARGRQLALYLLAHLVYADGLIALFAFGGLYATGIFGWTSFQIGLFGILLTVTGTIGAAVGGWLDDRFGPKAVVMGALIGLVVAAVLVLSISADRVLFLVPVAAPEPGHLFAASGERLYLALGAVIGALAGPVQAASRTLLARLAPPAQVTEYFGLYALSSRVTAFIGPLVVGAATALSASQRVGMATLVVFLALGAALLAAVKAPR